MRRLAFLAVLGAFAFPAELSAQVVAGRYRVVIFLADGGSFATPPIELAAGDYLEREFAVAEIPAELRDVCFAADVDRPAAYLPDNPVPRYPMTPRAEVDR